MRLWIRLATSWEIRMPMCIAMLMKERCKTICSYLKTSLKIRKINFMSAWFLLKVVGRRMRDHKSGGSIIFLTSIIGAERGLYAGAAAYSACSAAQQQVRSSALEIGRY